MFGGFGVIAEKKKVIIIDAQNRSDQADLMLELMQLYELNLSNVRHIILTHADSDHIGGLSHLKRVTGAKIVANSDETKRIETRHSLKDSRPRVLVHGNRARLM
jgi:glyoxylase-like metal-dependent hydrolase (beta-lactamase superfamily II)